MAGAAALKLGNTKMLGIETYTKYLYPLQIAAVLLLVAIIAAISLTLRARKDSKHMDPSEQVKAKKADRVRIVSDEADDHVARRDQGRRARGRSSMKGRP